MIVVRTFVFRFVLLALPGAALLAQSANDPWRIHLRGLGPIRIGMTVREVEVASGYTLYAQGAEAPSPVCGFYEFRHRSAVSLMFTNNAGPVTLGRIYISDPAIQTLSGIKVGSTIEALKKAYGRKLREQRNHYTEAPQFLFVPADKSDAPFRLLFETDRQVITEISVGRKEEIALVEGCL